MTSAISAWSPTIIVIVIFLYIFYIFNAAHLWLPLNCFLLPIYIKLPIRVLPPNCFPAAKRRIGSSILFFNLFFTCHAYDRKNCSVFICIPPTFHTVPFAHLHLYHTASQSIPYHYIGIPPTNHTVDIFHQTIPYHTMGILPPYHTIGIPRRYYLHLLTLLKHIKHCNSISRGNLNKTE